MRKSVVYRYHSPLCKRNITPMMLTVYRPEDAEVINVLRLLTELIFSPLFGVSRTRFETSSRYPKGWAGSREISPRYQSRSGASTAVLRLHASLVERTRVCMIGRARARGKVPSPL